MTTTPDTPAGGAVAWRAGFFDPSSNRAIAVDQHTWPNSAGFQNVWIVQAIEGQPLAPVSADAVLALVGKWREQARNAMANATPEQEAIRVVARAMQIAADELEALTRGEK